MSASIEARESRPRPLFRHPIPRVRSRYRCKLPIIDPVPEDHLELHCMEIWGGVEPADQSISTPGLDLWVYSQPFEGDLEGGDVHYLSLCGGGLITRLVVADVSGHGSSVAEFSRSLRSMVRKAINHKSQDRFVEELTRRFSEMAKLRRFATALVMTYLASTDRVAICNAGHPSPLLYRARDRAWTLATELAVPPVDELSDLPLGLDEDTLYRSAEYALGPGDKLVMYTDALSEAADAEGRMLGQDGLLELARGLKFEGAQPAQWGDRLLAAVAQHRQDKAPDDDVTLVVLHHNATPQRRAGLAEKLDVYAKFFGIKDY